MRHSLGRWRSTKWRIRTVRAGQPVRLRQDVGRSMKQTPQGREPSQRRARSNPQGRRSTRGAGLSICAGFEAPLAMEGIPSAPVVGASPLEPHTANAGRRYEPGARLRGMLTTVCCRQSVATMLDDREAEDQLLMRSTSTIGTIGDLFADSPDAGDKTPLGSCAANCGRTGGQGGDDHDARRAVDGVRGLSTAGKTGAPRR